MGPQSHLLGTLKQLIMGPHSYPFRDPEAHEGHKWPQQKRMPAVPGRQSKSGATPANVTPHSCTHRPRLRVIHYSTQARCSRRTLGRQPACQSLRIIRHGPQHGGRQQWIWQNQARGQTSLHTRGVRNCSQQGLSRKLQMVIVHKTIYAGQWSICSVRLNRADKTVR